MRSIRDIKSAFTCWQQNQSSALSSVRARGREKVSRVLGPLSSLKKLKDKLVCKKPKGTEEKPASGTSNLSLQDSAQDSGPSVLGLPAEAVNYIVSFLSVKEVAYFAQTCKLAYEHANAAPYWINFTSTGHFDPTNRSAKKIVNYKKEATYKAVADTFLKDRYDRSPSPYLRQLHQVVISRKLKECDIFKVAELLKQCLMSLQEMRAARLFTEEEVELMRNAGEKLSRVKLFHLLKKETIPSLACRATDLKAFLEVPDNYITSMHSNPSAVVSFLIQEPQNEEERLIQSNILKSNLFINVPCCPNGNTLLHEAASTSNADIDSEMIKALLDKGAKYSINWPNFDGMTALHFAVKRTAGSKVVKVLLRHGAQDAINQPDKEGRTPLHYAAMCQSIKITRTLLAYGAQDAINQPDKEGRTPLHYAAMYPNIEITRSLLAYEVQDAINQPDKEGCTPLHYAAMCTNIEITLNLLDHGAQDTINQRDEEGRTPLHYAVMWKDVEITLTLLNHGASQLEDNVGKTPLDYAVSSLFEKNEISRRTSRDIDEMFQTFDVIRLFSGEGIDCGLLSKLSNIHDSLQETLL